MKWHFCNGINCFSCEEKLKIEKCYIKNIYSEFNKLFYKKKRCNNCPNPNECSGFCSDKCLDYMDNKVPNYDCEYLRYAYVLRYFPVHVAELCQLYIKNTDEIVSHITLKKRVKPLTVYSLGTGPGTDLIAFLGWLKYAESYFDKSLSVMFTRFDVNDNWISQYVKIKNIYKDLIDSLKVSIDYTKKITDVLNINQILHKFDFASISYLLSEVIKDTDIQNIEKYVYKFWVFVKNNSERNSVILINDRPEQKIQEFSKRLFNYVKQAFPNSEHEEYSFRDYFPKSPEIRIDKEDWCGCKIPDDLKDKFKPKLNCASYQCIIYVDKN